MKTSLFRNGIVVLILTGVFIGCLAADQERPSGKNNGSLPGISQGMPSPEAEAHWKVKVKPAQLSDQTKTVVRAAGVDQIYVFDWLEKRESPGDIQFWAEVYMNGVRQEDPIHFVSGRGGSSNESGSGIQERQVVIALNTSRQEEEATLTISAGIADSTGISSTEAGLKLDNSNAGSLTSSLSEERELARNQPVTLITIIEDDGGSISSHHGEVLQYDEQGEIPEELLKYNRVMLIRVMLAE